MDIIRVGTRGSQLALTQTNQVIEQLRELHPQTAFETVIIKTTGDARQNVPFTEVGTKGMFVKEIEEALLGGGIDIAVHSLKDMPAELPAGLALLATPRREDARDALLTREGAALDDLPQGAIVGTSSLRRQAQLRNYRPDLQVKELRGNLDTRIRRLDERKYDAIVLACAGLERMGWADRIVERLDPRISTPAPGQGALALEGREGDSCTTALLAPLHHADTADAIAAERGFQDALQAGCTVPAGAYAQVEGNRITICAAIAMPDGSRIWRTEREGRRAEAREIGIEVARELLDAGAAEALSQTE